MNSDKHIVTAFDQDLDGLASSVLIMGGLVEQAIRDAAKSLDERDEDLAEAVRKRDTQIDELDMQINDDVASIIARRQPIASDLRLLLAMVKTTGNLERIGDYAKNIAKRTGVLIELGIFDNSTGALRRMARDVEGMLNDVLDAFLKRDVAKAEEIIARDAEIDEIYNALFRSFLTYMMEDPRNITATMHLHFIAKNLERMGDHVTGIAEELIYMVTGTRPSDPRPKGDATSTDASLSDVK
jgi:phosphate transport system protein